MGAYERDSYCIRSVKEISPVCQPYQAATERWQVRWASGSDHEQIVYLAHRRVIPSRIYETTPQNRSQAQEKIAIDYARNTGIIEKNSKSFSKWGH